jgi:hypothetical protein
LLSFIMQKREGCEMPISTHVYHSLTFELVRRHYLLSSSSQQLWNESRPAVRKRLGLFPWGFSKVIRQEDAGFRSLDPTPCASPLPLRRQPCTRVSDWAVLEVSYCRSRARFHKTSFVRCLTTLLLFVAINLSDTHRHRTSMLKG